MPSLYFNIFNINISFLNLILSESLSQTADNLVALILGKLAVD
jgi:hypothetical protein